MPNRAGKRLQELRNRPSELQRMGSIFRNQRTAAPPMGAHFVFDDEGKIQYFGGTETTPLDFSVPSAGGIDTDELFDIIDRRQLIRYNPSIEAEFIRKIMGLFPEAIADERARAMPKKPVTRPSVTAEASQPSVTAEASIEEQLAGVEAPEEMTFGKTPMERAEGVRSKEEELNLMMGITEALQRMGSAPSASQILLGIQPQPAGVPARWEEERQSLAQRRRGLEARMELPEYDPDSEISKEARAVLQQALGRPVSEGISAGQIKEQFGDIGGLFTGRMQLEAGLRKERRLPDNIVTELARGRTFLAKTKDLADAYKQVESEMGPIWSRYNSIAKKIGLDNPEVSFVQSGLRDAFAKYLYGTSGKQLSNREIDFMSETAAQAWMQGATFKKLLAAMRDRQLKEYNAMLTQQAANGRDVVPHLLPGWRMTRAGPVYGKAEDQKLKIPKNDPRAKEAIKKAEEVGQPYELVE